MSSSSYQLHGEIWMTWLLLIHPNQLPKLLRCGSSSAKDPGTIHGNSVLLITICSSRFYCPMISCTIYLYAGTMIKPVQLLLRSSSLPSSMSHHQSSNERLPTELEGSSGVVVGAKCWDALTSQIISSEVILDSI